MVSGHCARQIMSIDLERFLRHLFGCVSGEYSSAAGLPQLAAGATVAKQPPQFGR